MDYFIVIHRLEGDDENSLWIGQAKSVDVALEKAKHELTTDDDLARDYYWNQVLNVGPTKPLIMRTNV